MVNNRYPIRERKHRLPLEHYRGQIAVSFTACLAGRTHALVDENTVAEFITILRVTADKHGCTVPIYCFMPDHAHIVTQGMSDESDSWRAMVEFKQRTGYWFRCNNSSHRWQKDFHDHILGVSDDLKEHVRYVANNPVRKGIVGSASEYPFLGSVGVDLATIVGDSL